MATNTLYVQLGDTAEEQYRALLDVYELLGTEPDEGSSGWGKSLVTADEGARLIEAVRTPPNWLGEENAALIRESMTATADDVYASQDFGVGILARETGIDELFLKNGWLAEQADEWSVSSIGAV